jgi:hypothetical protein
MWHERFNRRSALPRPRAHIRFIVGPTCQRVRRRRLDELPQQPGALVREHVQQGDGLNVGLAADMVRDPTHFRRGHPLERDVRGVSRRLLPGAPRGLACRLAVLRGVAHFFTTFLSDPEWPRKIRVGENSPNLWPTRFSVTYTGTQVLPLYTEIV